MFPKILILWVMKPNTSPFSNIEFLNLKKNQISKIFILILPTTNILKYNHHLMWINTSTFISPPSWNKNKILLIVQLSELKKNLGLSMRPKFGYLAGEAYDNWLLIDFYCWSGNANQINWNYLLYNFYF